MPPIPDLTQFLTLSRDLAGFLGFWLAFIGTGVGIGFLFGRGKLGNVFIDVYMSVAVTRTLLAVVPLPELPYAGAVLFFVVLAFLIGIDQSLFDLHISNAAYDIFWRVFVMGVLVTGMAVSAFISFLPAKAVASLPFPQLSLYFGSPVATALWFSLPVFVLVFMNRRLGR